MGDGDSGDNITRAGKECLGQHMASASSRWQAAKTIVFALALLSLSSKHVDGHGAVVDPPPRNAVDRDVAPWNGPLPKALPNVDKPPAWCAVTSKEGKLSGQNAQACFWFSNGCAVGCPKCDGSSRGPIPGTGNGSATNPPTAWGRNKV